jgi:hypothetical protein
MIALIAICIVVIILLIYLWYKYKGSNQIHCIGGDSCYNVLKKSDADIAAQLLHRLNQANLKLVEYLQQVQNNPTCSKLYQEIAANLIHKYDPNAIFEHQPSDKRFTSYVKGKGEEIAFCLRDAITDKVHDYDVLIFVNLHELSHIAMTGLDPNHPPEFWQIFKHILIMAEKAKIYTPIDYSKKNIVCCGIDITYNPYFDDKIEVGECSV